MELNRTAIVLLGILILLILSVYKGLIRSFSNKNPMTKKQYIQAEINELANSNKYFTGSNKKKGGCSRIIFIILLILIFSWIWLGYEFHL